MHKNGFIHRNIRPEMIIFQSDNAVGDIKLVDMITVIEFQEIVESDPLYESVVVTTPHYKAPELIPKKKVYNEKCDVWSCGAMLYNMITGIPPFFESDPEQLEEKIKSGVLSC